MSVQKVAVIGSGLMGRGIAHVAALGGFETVMVDVSDEILQKALGNIRSEMEKGVSLGKLSTDAKDAALERLVVETSLEKAAQDADLVIEAIPEDMKLKADTFTRLDHSAPAGTILASNTSSLSITEMAASTRRADRFVGMHFFNPAPVMKLVEVIRGSETSTDTTQFAKSFCLKLGKEAVEVKESPGFVVNRLLVPMMNEAFNLLMEGVASPEDIDKAMRLGTNMPMGPFELADFTGLDIGLDTMETLHRETGDPRFRPSPLLRQYVRAGRLGRKTSRGVFDYATTP